MTDFPVDPARMALVNVDMQNCFVEGYPMSAPDGPQLLEPINRMARACRENGILVIHTAHNLRADGSNIGVLAETLGMKPGGAVCEEWALFRNECPK